MSPQVHSQVAFPVELLVTIGARKSLLAHVGSTMALQLAGSDVSIPANIAVTAPHMEHGNGFRWEHFVTVLTKMVFLDRGLCRHCSLSGQMLSVMSDVWKEFGCLDRQKHLSNFFNS